MSCELKILQERLDKAFQEQQELEEAIRVYKEEEVSVSDVWENFFARLHEVSLEEESLEETDESFSFDYMIDTIMQKELENMLNNTLQRPFSTEDLLNLGKLQLILKQQGKL